MKPPWIFLVSAFNPTSPSRSDVTVTSHICHVILSWRHHTTCRRRITATWVVRCASRRWTPGVASSTRWRWKMLTSLWGGISSEISWLRSAAINICSKMFRYCTSLSGEYTCLFLSSVFSIPLPRYLERPVRSLVYLPERELERTVIKLIKIK